MNPKLKLLSLCSVLAFSANANYAFSTTYLNIPINYFKSFLAECMGGQLSEAKYNLLWNLLLHCWFVGFFLGIWLNPVFNEKYGRKSTFVIFSIMSFLSSLLRIVAINYHVFSLLVISRIVTGVASSVLYQTQILFLQECAPTSLRGTTSFLSGIWFALMVWVSIFLGQDYILGQNVEILVVISSVLALVSLLAVLPLKETPKYLFLKRQDYDKAQESINFYFDGNNDNFLDEIKHEVEIKNDNNNSVFNKANLKLLWSKTEFRQACILSIVACQNTVAFWSILMSSTDFLERINLSTSISEISTLSMATCYLLGTIVGTFMVSRFKRRTMVIHITSLNVLSLAGFCFFAEMSFIIPVLKYGCWMCLLIYGFTYGAGAGPVNRFIGGELVAQNERSMLQAVSATVNQIVVIVTTFGILPLYGVLDSFAILVLFVVPSIGCLIYLWFNLPETKDQNIDDIVKKLSGQYNNLTHLPITNINNNVRKMGAVY